VLQDYRGYIYLIGIVCGDDRWKMVNQSLEMVDNRNLFSSSCAVLVSAGWVGGGGGGGGVLYIFQVYDV
jgi:hypothetical protein